ncbi:MAG TPA: tRNA 2-selenouridine(34) synthase MnmH [Ginsengibacter sp.]|nr:tRNA 2-selenouridine(34) synthase MnmH [Ginsengibacter sp.]
MAIEQADIEIFIKLSKDFPVIDVRSPGEFSHAHIPGAYSLPLFTDEQRKIIGTAYKQQSRQIAVKTGIGYFSERMKNIFEETEELIKSWQEANNKEIISNNKETVLVHCWRGGMRSGAVAWLLNLFGFKIYTLKGGYKSFRGWALAQFEKKYKIKILGGYTGSGKTRLLQEIKKQGNNIIDLESIANHKGSAFGALGEKIQPGQEMFENLLSIELYKATWRENQNITNEGHYTKTTKDEIWIEDESRHIGIAGIPNALWKQMRESPLFFLDIPFEERLQHIISTYGQFGKAELVNCIQRIQKRLGGLETKKATTFLYENNLRECFSILLHYYDKFYEKSLNNRENIDAILNKIPCATVDINNLQKFLS